MKAPELRSRPAPAPRRTRSHVDPVGYDVAHLQRTVGNQAVLRMLDRSHILQRTCAGGAPCVECAGNAEGTLRRAAHSAAPAAKAPPIVDAALRSPGRPLSADTRAFFEPRFGRDFSAVRLHSDQTAAESAHAVNARAYTVGSQIVLGAAQHERTDGDRLIAHELAHVVQQSAGMASGALEIGKADAPAEREADAAAHAVVSGNSRAPVLAGDHGAPGVQRTAASCPDDWRTTVQADHDRALSMIDVARRKLSAYDGTSPPEVKTALEEHFKRSNSGVAGWVHFSLGYLRMMADFTRYDCEDNKSWWCGSDTLAKTFWCVPGIAIRVCQPQYFEQSGAERSTTLIHEWAHKYGCKLDLGYRGDENYPDQRTSIALINADPFAQLVKDVQ
ncbi:MAG TPA: DUF4157 domain-containing protein [Candidatus Elarobacter sp.]